MKRQISILVLFTSLCIGFNAFANVDFYKIRIQTSNQGWVTRTGYDSYENNESTPRLYKFHTRLVGSGTIYNSKVYVSKYNPTSKFYDHIWRRYEGGPILSGHEYMSYGKRIYESYWNSTDFDYGNCLNPNYMSFDFKYADGQEWVTFLFSAGPYCEE